MGMERSALAWLASQSRWVFCFVFWSFFTWSKATVGRSWIPGVQNKIKIQSPTATPRSCCKPTVLSPWDKDSWGRGHYPGVRTPEVAHAINRRDFGATLQMFCEGSSTQLKSWLLWNHILHPCPNHNLFGVSGAGVRKDPGSEKLAQKSPGQAPDWGRGGCQGELREENPSSCEELGKCFLYRWPGTRWLVFFLMKVVAFIFLYLNLCRMIVGIKVWIKPIIKDPSWNTFCSEMIFFSPKTVGHMFSGNFKFEGNSW